MKKRKKKFKLKPCPFCGSGEVYLCDNAPHHYGYSYVYCDECGCRTDYCEKTTYAIEDWNRRPDDE